MALCFPFSQTLPFSPHPKYSMCARTIGNNAHNASRTRGIFLRNSLCLHSFAHLSLLFSDFHRFAIRTNQPDAGISDIPKSGVDSSTNFCRSQSIFHDLNPFFTLGIDFGHADFGICQNPKMTCDKGSTGDKNRRPLKIKNRSKETGLSPRDETRFRRV